MKSEMEIKEKLRFYEAMLEGMESWKMIDNHEMLRRTSRYFPREIMEMMNYFNCHLGIDAKYLNDNTSWVFCYYISLGITIYITMYIGFDVEISFDIIQNKIKEGFLFFDFWCYFSKAF